MSLNKRFDLWYKKICSKRLIEEVENNPILFNNIPFAWEVAYEISSYHSFAKNSMSIEDIIYFSRERWALLDEMWPSSFMTRKELDAFYIESHKVLPWGHGIFRADHKDIPRRENFLRRIDVLQQLKSLGAHSVLDYGAGGGITAFCALAMGFETVGYHEFSIWHSYVQWKLDNSDLPNKENMIFSAVDKELPTQKYDAIICSDVPEHVYDPVELLENIGQILKPNGLLSWVSLFGEGINCHLHPQYSGKEEPLLNALGFTRVAPLAANYKGFTGVFKYTHQKKSPVISSPPPNAVIVKADTHSYVLQESDKPKIKVAIIHDMEGWAWWHRGNNIKENIGDNIEIDVIFYKDLLDFDKYDFIILFESYITERIANLPQHKTIIGCSSPANFASALNMYESTNFRGFIVNNYSMYKASKHLDNVFYCPNGVDETIFCPPCSYNSNFTACWVGNTASCTEKGLDLIAQACEQMNIPFIYYDRAQNDIVYTHAELRDEFYHKANVYINASVDEGTPNPALEALACGLPVITTNTGNMPELIKNGENGYIVERNVESIVDALKLIKKAHNTLMPQKARESIVNGWRWKDQAKRYAKMLTILAQQGDLDSENGLFSGKNQVYLASADNMVSTILNCEDLTNNVNYKVEQYATVIGGLSGLNYINLLQPKNILFYDINSSMITYCSFILELIGICSSPSEFISRVFARSVDHFENKHNMKLTFKSQEKYLESPVDQDIIDQTLDALSKKSSAVYEEYVIPAAKCRVLDGELNCRQLLPCWPIGDTVPVGAGESTGFDANGKRIPNTNTFFYNYGWLASKSSYMALSTALKNAKVSFKIINLLDDPAATWMSAGASNVIHVSNINDWFPEKWQQTLSQWKMLAKQSMTDLRIITSMKGNVHLHRDPHCLSYEMLKPYVSGKVIEITHKPNWGFHEFCPLTITADEYIASPQQANTIILHILLGNNIDQKIFSSIIEKALIECEKLVILEHNPASKDWDTPLTVPQKEELLYLIQRHALEAGKKVSYIADIPGYSDDKRNFIVVVEGQGKEMITNYTPSVEQILKYTPYFSDTIKISPDGKVLFAYEDIFIAANSVGALFIGKEIFIERNYDFEDVDDFIMIDIGFNLGITSLWMAKRPNIKKIYGYEPFKQTYLQGLNNLKNNPKLASKINLFNFGLGMRDKVSEVKYDPVSPGVMSTVWDKFHSNAELESEIVQVKDVAAILEPIFKEHQEKVFVKMDCEGAEFEIIPLLYKRNLLEKIDVLQMEWHRRYPTALLKMLNEKGFICFVSRHHMGKVGMIKAVKK